MNRYKTGLLRIIAATALTTACGRQEPVQEAAKQEYTMPTKQEAIHPAVEYKAPEPPAPAVEELERITGSYKLQANSKQIADVDYRKWSEDGILRATLDIKYLRPGEEKSDPQERLGEGYTCMHAAEFSFESTRDSETISSGYYTINGGTLAKPLCGKSEAWTTEEKPRDNYRRIVDQEADDMQRLYTSTIESLYREQERARKEQLAPYLPK